MEKELTSVCVRLNSDMYDKFRNIDLIKKITLSDFVNYCLEKFVDDKEFQENISQNIINMKVSKYASKKMKLHLDVDLNFTKKIQ